MFHRLFPSFSVSSFAGAVALTAAVVVAVLGYGMLLLSPSAADTDDQPLAWLCVLIAGGLALLAVTITIVGHIWLHRSSVIGVLAVGVVLTGRHRVALARLLRRLADRGLGLSRIELRILAIVGGFCVLILLSGLRPPGARDELDYHWTGPTGWAAAGHWVNLPGPRLRLVAGPALAERLFSIGAVFRSPTTAHWTHSLFFLVLLAGAGALASRFGGSAVYAIATTAAIPAMANQASLAYNDIAFAALLVAGVVLALLARTRRHWGAVAFILCAAVLIKPLAIAFLPAGIVVVLLAGARPRRLELAVVAGVAVAMAGLAIAHTLRTTGEPIPPAGGVQVARFSKDPLATGRLPVPSDVAILPALPLLTAIAGSREPYGGRTGATFLLFLPLLTIHLVRRRELRAWPGWPVLAGACLSLLVAAVFVKTRFHGFTWVCLAAVIAVLLRQLRAVAVFQAAFMLCIVVGMADSARILLRPWA